MFRYEQCFNGLIEKAVQRNEPTNITRKIIPDKIGGFSADVYYVWRYQMTKTEKDKEFKKILHEELRVDDIQDGKKWKWHHIIPSIHIRSLYSGEKADKIINEEMPCILINQTTEHEDYSLLSYSNFRIIAKLPSTNVLVKPAERIDYLSKLRASIPQVYHNKTLRILANNILDELIMM